MFNEKSENRIDIIDGFRAFSIIGVMLYHFFSTYVHFTVNGKPYYPYSNKYDFFFLGKYGVEFFFIISGFVIFYTLTNTTDLITFGKKRFIRLFPSMLVSSVVIYLFTLIYDVHNILPEAHELKNFVPSLTFIRPSIFSEISGFFSKKIQFEYINSSYWSLWPELQFYIVASLLFFYDKEKYTRNLFVIAFSLIIIQNFILGNQEIYNVSPYWGRIVLLYLNILKQHFNIGSYIFYFAIGSLFYSLFFLKENKEKVTTKLKLYIIILALLHIVVQHNISLILVNLVMISLFVAFIYFPNTISFFKNKRLAKIGLCSYFLYLIHEPIGILIINTFGGKKYASAFILPLLLIFILIIISIYYYENIEKKMAKVCRKILLKA